jgi:hypothetical protein
MYDTNYESTANVELELELIQTQMAQKKMLRAEVYGSVFACVARESTRGES